MLAALLTFLNNIFSIFKISRGKKAVEGIEAVSDAVQKLDKNPTDVSDAERLLDR